MIYKIVRKEKISFYVEFMIRIQLWYDLALILSHIAIVISEYLTLSNMLPSQFQISIRNFHELFPI
ncbi:hypothetical protein IJ00_05640 [Calothrix sp. 336/3]|nr:hypothetical protein IJ00_05640 [Calothrix sp. 336/3]